MRYAEVIGDPIAQSKSPIIHRYWLEQLGLSGDYRATLVTRSTLAAFFGERRTDPAWLGCNVTIPHKEQAAALIDRIEPGAEALGAVNCVVPFGGALVGYNTDLEGIAAALDSAELHGRKAAVIGAGGAAKAAVVYLAERGARSISLVVRNPQRAEALRTLAPEADVSILPFDRAEEAFEGAAVIVNASPLGMSGADRMPSRILDAVAKHAENTTAFDMVTTPAATEFLSAAESGGGHPVDGLTMLLGQAANAFTLFFGVVPPSADQRLRDLLITDRCDSG